MESEVDRVLVEDIVPVRLSVSVSDGVIDWVQDMVDEKLSVPVMLRLVVWVVL